MSSHKNQTGKTCWMRSGAVVKWFTVKSGPGDVYWRACAAASDRVCIMSGQQQQHRIRLDIYLYYSMLYTILTWWSAAGDVLSTFCALPFPACLSFSSRLFKLTDLCVKNLAVGAWFHSIIRTSKTSQPDLWMTRQSFLSIYFYWFLNYRSLDWKTRHCSLFHRVDPEIVKRSMDLELMT